MYQGGTRSGKTYNLIIAFILKLAQENNKVLSICRETMPSLKKTVFRDFEEIMRNLGLWNNKNFHKSTMTYKLGTNTIEFLNLDDDQKVRGAKRNYLYVNEANETKLAIWKQLIFRTSEMAVIDYNPSEEFHWIYDEVIPRLDTDFFKSTYLDNPFLPEEQIKEIERLKNVDPNYWRIYGLGERGISETTIFKNWEIFKGEEFPQGEIVYGLDFGFNDPNALVEVTFYDGNLYVKELLYKSGMTTPDVVDKLKELEIDSQKEIYADNARPETIQEIFNNGFNIHPCVKGPGSIKTGIDWIRRKRIFIHPESTNLIKEIKSYKWKINKDEKPLDEPVDVNNHLIDALRYAMTTKMKPADEYMVGESLTFNF